MSYSIFSIFTMFGFYAKLTQKNNNKVRGDLRLITVNAFSFHFRHVFLVQLTIDDLSLLMKTNQPQEFP